MAYSFKRIIRVVGILMLISILLYVISRTSPEDGAVTDDGVDASATSTEQGTADVSDAEGVGTAGGTDAGQGGAQGTQTTGNTTTAASTEKQVASSGVPASVYMPYDAVAYTAEYMVGWTARVGSKASIVLMKGSEKVTDISGCADMNIEYGVTKYCTWVPTMPQNKYGTTGFTLKLRVYDGSGALVAESTSQSITLDVKGEFTFIPYSERTYGWEVRYPETWSVKKNADRVVFARDASGLTTPFASNEAFVISVCSLARESCIERTEAFRRDTTYRSSDTVGNKRSETRVYSEGGQYIREDMMEIDRKAYFVQRRSVDSGGTVFSPYVRKSLDQFSFTSSDLVIKTFELDESFRAGTMYVEYLNNVPTYVRIYTGASGCKSEISSAAITKRASGGFEFVKGTCTVSVRSDDDTLEAKEEGCETLHAKECAFEGEYVPE